MKIYGVSGLLISAGLGLLVSSGPALAGNIVNVSDVRIGQHPDKTRVVIDLNRKIKATHETSKDGKSVFVHLPNLKWRARLSRV